MDRKRNVRRLAWFTLFGQTAFVLAWLIAGQLESHYNHATQYISELGAKTAENPWIVNSALVLFGLTLASLALALWNVLPRRARTLAPVGLFALAGLGFVLAGLNQLECETTVSHVCDRRFDDGLLSNATYVHVWSAFGAEILFLLTPFAIAWALWPRPLARLPLLAGLSGVVIFFVFWLANSGDDPAAAGLVQRIGFGVIHAWSGIVAIALLIWANVRRGEAPAAGGEGALEPFRFLEGALDGSGEMEYRAWARPLRFPEAFSYRWRVDYEGSAMWLIRHTLRFDGDRHVIDRLTLARPMSATVMHVSADDMPGGAHTELVPGGLRLEPAWFLNPWWGFPWPVLGSGEISIEGDDLRGRFDLLLFGFLPLARMRFQLARGPRSARRA